MITIITSICNKSMSVACLMLVGRIRSIVAIIPADRRGNHQYFPITEMTIHYEDYKLHIKNYIVRLLRRRWDGCTGNKLNKVEPV